METRIPALVCLGGPMISEQTQQAGVIERARTRGVTLFLLSGSMLENPQGFENQRSVIFDLVDKARVDGLIFNSDFLGHFVGLEQINSFLSRYKPLPIVNIGAPVPGIPTLVVDFYQGMYDLISHLIEVHHFQRIAFVRGPEKSYSGNERYRAYQKALIDHGIPLDDELVAPGTFYPPSGQEAVRLFLDRRRLYPRRDIHAIAAANDYMALDVMKALQDRGYLIPEDIAVVGFDDEEEAVSSNPPLTTAHLPIFEIGERQVDMILAIIQGESVPEAIKMPAPMVVRQSCGCINPILLQAAVGQGTLAESVLSKVEIRTVRDKIFLAMTKVIGFYTDDPIQNSVASFLDLMLEELEDRPEILSAQNFVARLENFFGQIRDLVRYTHLWHSVLSVMRREILPYLSEARLRNRFEDLCQQARALIGDMAQRMLVRLKNQGTYLDKLLHDINQEMTTALSVNELMDILARDLPMLGIRSCYLSLYENHKNPGDWSRLYLAYQDHQRVNVGPEGLLFPSKELIPKSFYHLQQAHILACLPLYFREEQIGFVVFEVGPSYGPLYEALREQISSTLKRIQLHQEAEKARRQAEEADRLKSIFLSVVSHELRTPLSMIVSLSELLLEEQGQTGSRLPFQHELGVIHATGQHLDRLLRDVLDLGRSQMGQLKLEFEVVDFAEVVKEAAAVGEELAREKDLRWDLTLPASLPSVWGDRTRLRQVLLNLISNACKFTNRGGIGMEVQNDSQTIMVTVRDTGLGIPPEEQAAIFDEFHQSERTATRGYGGMGLGLAITRRLVELHGGKISVHSSGQEGSGAVFTFTLPCLGYHPDRFAKSQELPMVWDGTVLILTKCHEGNSVLRGYLEERGFKVTEVNVSYAEDWFGKILEAPPGALVLDCEPAAEWGMRLVNFLQENPATRDLPVLFSCLSPQDNCGSVLEMSCLSKPLSVNALAQFLRSRGIEPRKKVNKPKTILVVDDEPAVLEMHAKRVRELLPDSRVLEARNGLQALDIMKEVRPDLILLDLMMPELDGFGVLEKVRSMESTRDIPVIILTAQTLTGEFMQRLNRGITAVLNKGLFRKEEVLAQVEAALSRSKRLGSLAQRIARQAMVYLHSHYEQQITRREIAQALGVNERYLTRCFREETGITPMEYLRRYRIKQAQRMLEEGQKSITEVALEAGFSSSAYFSRVFRQETGMNPQEYQRGKRVTGE